MRRSRCGTVGGFEVIDYGGVGCCSRTPSEGKAEEAQEYGTELRQHYCILDESSDV